eukprot:5271662-Heterocapsa_arctica.AAC.1
MDKMCTSRRQAPEPPTSCGRCPERRFSPEAAVPARTAPSTEERARPREEGLEEGRFQYEASGVAGLNLTQPEGSDEGVSFGPGMRVSDLRGLRIAAGKRLGCATPQGGGIRGRTCEAGSCAEG